ncbi:MAG: hypothetical protein A2169_12580 [Deltaproteobacteria bacterium RBG_13_47_9]|nr:MAG: hypothetical protein A2169_12580 [Deltaproteobacteria bacterium RBG_13_47_9]
MTELCTGTGKSIHALLRCSGQPHKPTVIMITNLDFVNNFVQCAWVFIVSFANFLFIFYGLQNILK